MRVLHVASECEPFARTGGLGDVVGALPTAQRALGASTTALIPLHRAARAHAAREGIDLVDTGVATDVALGGHDVTVRFLVAERPGRAPTLLAAADALFDRDRLYGHADDALRFAAFARATLQALPRLPGAPYDVLHAHDWHAALVPALLATTFREALPDVRAVQTLHSLAFQGIFPKEAFPLTGLPWDAFHPECAEFYDHVSFLKAGIALADAVATVSPTYAREIKTPAFGVGLDGFLRRFHVHGILNGVDPATWSPSHDPHLAARYDADDLAGKEACRAALHAECGWTPEPGVPLLGVVSRLTDQKGLDLVAELVAELTDARLLIVGTGEHALESTFRDLARLHPDRVAAKLVFDDALAHRVIAGADVLLVPSRFEPCGLTQLYAMAYGTPPVVHATGGLADTVHDPGDACLAAGEGSGFVFRHADADGLRWALRRAIRTYREAPEAWATVQRAAMRRDFSWVPAARAYGDLYAAIRAR